MARELLWDFGSSLHANLAVVSARAQSAAQQTLSEAQADVKRYGTWKQSSVSASCKYSKDVGGVEAPS